MNEKEEESEDGGYESEIVVPFVPAKKVKNRYKENLARIKPGMAAYEYLRNHGGELKYVAGITSSKIVD